MPIKLTETQVAVSNLEIGMHVVRLDRPWEDTDFLLQGFVVESQNDIESLQRQCEFVFIEGREQLSSDYGKRQPERRKQKEGLFLRVRHRETVEKAENIPGTEGASHRVNYINKIDAEKELFVARESYSSAKLTVHNIMDAIRIGRVIDMAQARTAVDTIVDSILRNNDALAWLTKIKHQDDYTAEHCLNVCVLTATFARHLGMVESDIRKVALSGLLHDVGKAKIPEQILTKTGRLTDEEFDLMKRHPVFGRDLLASLKAPDRAAIDVAHSHHERIDGRGYPRGLSEQQIPYFAKLISIVDCYDAITSNRCYDSARASMEALDIIYKGRGNQFDSYLAEAFIKCIGIYPPGSIVELTNGSAAIVISSNKDNKLRPKVLMVRNSEKELAKEIVIDLNANKYREKNNVIYITREVPNGTHGIDLQTYLDKGLILSHGHQDSDLTVLAMGKGL